MSGSRCSTGKLEFSLSLCMSLTQRAFTYYSTCKRKINNNSNCRQGIHSASVNISIPNMNLFVYTVGVLCIIIRNSEPPNTVVLFAFSSLNTIGMEGGIFADIDDYDLTLSSSSDSEQKTPPPKGKADDAAMATNLQITPKSKRPPPTEGYIYGFVLPFTVDKEEYCVVKIGMTTGEQLVRRLREHDNEFKKATGSFVTSVPIFQEPIPASINKDEAIRDFKLRDQAEVFLVSHVKDGLAAAEDGARECIGVAPFRNVFRNVFSDSRRVTTTEWVIARKQVKEDIRAQFRDNKLDEFESADDFLDKLRELNKRRYVEVTVSLQTLDNEIYRNSVKVPQYSLDCRATQ